MAKWYFYGPWRNDAHDIYINTSHKMQLTLL